MIIYCDIDGTLTDKAEGTGGKPVKAMINRLKALIKHGHEVMLWSAGGTEYARAFAKKHKLNCPAFGKPDIAVDDRYPDIRTPWHWCVITLVMFMDPEVEINAMKEMSKKRITDDEWREQEKERIGLEKNAAAVRAALERKPRVNRHLAKLFAEHRDLISDKTNRMSKP